MLAGDEHIMTLARCGIALLSADGCWHVANPALCRMLGADADDLEGVPAHRVLFQDDAERIEALLQAADDGPHGGLLVRRCGKDARWFELHIDALAGGGHLLQFHDASERERATRQLQAMEHERERIVYGLSHELHASLRAIEGFARLLDQRQGDALDEQGRDHLSRIRAAAAQGGTLLADLIEYARVGTRAQQDAPVDVSLLADWICAELRDAEPAREADIEIEPGLHARGDERQLRQLLGRLLHNAWKFSAAAARSRIRVSGERDGERILLRIEDNGCGFDMRHADKLFQPFRRLHGAEQGSGHGLGLAIAHRIAERHDGRLWAHSQDDSGSTFFIELPAANPVMQT